MAKTGSLNVRWYVEGYDLSGDANSLSGVGYSNTLLEVPTLDSPAMKRVLGPVAGNVTMDAWFDSAAGNVHAVMTSDSGEVPTTDQEVLIPLNSAVGDPSMHFVGKIADYTVNSGSESDAMSVNCSYETTGGYALFFGDMLTSHQDTHSSASDGTAVDNSASSANGGNSILQVFSLASGTATVKVQHSTNNSTWADLITFTAATGVTSEIKEVSGTVNRYLRVNSSGTFSNLVLAVDFARG